MILLAPAAIALSVDDVRLGVHPDKTRMVLDLSNTTDFRVFTLSSPYRMVIDLPTFDWHAGTLQAADATKITAIRQGDLEAGISRIVFDLSHPIAVKSAFLLPASSAKPNRLVIDYSPVNESLFESYRGEVHGTLTSEGAAPTSTVRNLQPARAPDYGAIPAKKPSYSKPLIVIDPGHGGNDPGAVGRHKSKEKNIVLALAKQLKNELEGSGRYRVLLTRTNDKYIRLSDRVTFARKHQADLFVSLHADSIEKSSVRGSSFYTLSETASDKQTARLAAKENRSDIIAGVDLSTEDKDVANILVDLAMRDTMNQSTFVANTLVREFKNNSIRTLENPHRFAGFAVLKAADIPSVLIEAGFMSNRSEEKLLSTASHRKKIAAAIAEGINAYFRQVALNDL